MINGLVKSGSARIREATGRAKAISTRAIAALLISATTLERAKILPTFPASLPRNSATYFVAVRPRPSPAKIPKVPTVLWIIPSWPKHCLPRKRAHTIEATRVKPREITAPATDQLTPRAKRARKEPTGAKSFRLVANHCHALKPTEGPTTQ